MTATQGSGTIDASRPNVFIHTNHKQMVGALVSQYSMKRNSADPDAFDVHLIRHEDHPWFAEYEGREYLRDGASRVWHNEDLQSFTPLRFMPPELMGYQGRAVVTDPDVFAVGDVLRAPESRHEGQPDHVSPALRCEGLRGHPRHERDAPRLRAADPLEGARAVRRDVPSASLDYQDWIGLKKEDRSTPSASSSTSGTTSTG